MKKLRRISIKKKISTRISKVLSFSVISENTRLKKVKCQFFEYLRERSGKESIDRKEVDYETPKLNAFSVGPDDVPSI